MVLVSSRREYKFEQRKDRYGWVQNHEGKWFYTVFVEHGRILDEPNKQGEQYPLKSGLLKIAKTGKVNFRFTCNQNLIVSDVREEDKAEIDQILKEYGISDYTEKVSALRKTR